MTNTTVWLVSIGQQITGCPFDAGKALQCARTVRKVLAQPKHSGSLPRLLHGILPTLSSMQDGPKMHPSAASHACHAGVCRGLEHAPDIGVVRWNEIWQRVKKQERKAKKKLADLRATSRGRGFSWGSRRLRNGPEPDWDKATTANAASSVCWPKPPQTETARCAGSYATGGQRQPANHR